jgi:hypothetical protein
MSSSRAAGLLSHSRLRGLPLHPAGERRQGNGKLAISAREASSRKLPISPMPPSLSPTRKGEERCLPEGHFPADRAPESLDTGPAASTAQTDISAVPSSPRNFQLRFGRWGHRQIDNISFPFPASTFVHVQKDHGA